MKIKEAQDKYRQQRQALINQRKELIKKRDELKKKVPASEEEKEYFSETAATLELSIKEVNQRFDENQTVLDQLTEQYAAVWNAEVSRQQGDALQDAAMELGKVMAVFRRIASGAKVPAKDEQKLMEYSMEMYKAAKNLATMRIMEEKRKKYDSLWDDEEEEQEEYDPQGKAENAEASVDLPEIEIPNIEVEF